MHSVPFSHTFVGALAVAVLAGVIVLVIQKNFFEDVEKKIPSPGYTSKGDTPSPPPMRKDFTEQFPASLGATKAQIEQCVARNSRQFLQGRDYTLEEDAKRFGEVLITLHNRDSSLKDLLRGCAASRAR